MACDRLQGRFFRAGAVRHPAGLDYGTFPPRVVSGVRRFSCPGIRRTLARSACGGTVGKWRRCNARPGYGVWFRRPHGREARKHFACSMRKKTWTPFPSFLAVMNVVIRLAHDHRPRRSPLAVLARSGKCAAEQPSRGLSGLSAPLLRSITSMVSNISSSRNALQSANWQQSLRKPRAGMQHSAALL